MSLQRRGKAKIDLSVSCRAEVTGVPTWDVSLRQRWWWRWWLDQPQRRSLWWCHVTTTHLSIKRSLINQSMNQSINQG